MWARIYHIPLVSKRFSLSFQNNPKDLAVPRETDLDLRDCFAREKKTTFYS